MGSSSSQVNHQAASSPVTPTPPLPAMQRSAASMMRGKGLDLGLRVIAQDSPAFYRPKLNAEQRACCEEALPLLRSRSREFPALNMRTALSLDVFQAAQANAAKNRYLDVLPYDASRVVLRRSREGHSDYINASYIQCPASNLPTFIATQGPLRSTVQDFWEMVMQHRCSVIVMLTRFMDGRQEKCAPYFPLQLNQAQTFGNLRVTQERCVRSQFSLVKRVLNVARVDDDEPPLHVLHFEYLDWPDHGVPPSTVPIRELFRCLRSIPTDSPFVVHCSAGIGRTGTYIAIDYALRRILEGDISAVQLDAIVELLRRQRVGMVQMKSQYEFCHQAIVDEIEETLLRCS